VTQSIPLEGVVEIGVRIEVQNRKTRMTRCHRRDSGKGDGVIPADRQWTTSRRECGRNPIANTIVSLGGNAVGIE
jgi:hypothetical protein